MACHEIAALRLGLMQILGRESEAERAHELDELGDAAHVDGPIRSLSRAETLADLKRLFDAAVDGLEDKVAQTPADAPQRPYYQTLVVLTKKVEMELDNHISAMTRLYENLEDVHDFVHEVYPAK